MMWRCPKLVRYWSEILKIISLMFRVKLELEPKTCILGYIDGGLGYRSTAIAIARCLYQARKLIAQSWQSKTPQTPEECVRTINSLVWKEKTNYTRLGNYSKFVKICQDMEPLVTRDGMPPVSAALEAICNNSLKYGR